MTLEDLVGEHELSGVDFGTLPEDYETGRYDDASTMTFVLDGHAYCVMEDPGDGYRSSMRDITEVPIESVTNRFEAVRVLGRYRTQGEYSGTDDVLELLDATNGLVVLEAGTENIHDYYPGFVANFMPDRLACNQAAGRRP